MIRFMVRHIDKVGMDTPTDRSRSARDGTPDGVPTPGSGRASVVARSPLPAAESGSLSTTAASNGDALSLGSAARLLGVSAVTLRRWADAGRIECFRTPGGQRRFLRRDLERIRDRRDGGRVVRPPDPATAAQSEQARMFAALRNASRAIASSATSDEVLEVIARACATALGTSDATVFSYDARADTLQAQAIYEATPTGYVEELHDPFPVDEYPGGRELLDVGGVLEERLSDPGLDPSSRASMLEYNEMASLSVGIRFGDEPLGLLVLTETARERRFTEAERELAVALGEQAAIGLHTAQMFRRQQRQNRRLASLLESSRASTSSLVLEEVLRAVVHAAVNVLEVDGCVVWEYDGERDALIERSAYEISTDYEAGDTVVMISDRPIDGVILRGRVPVVETLSDPTIDSLSRASMLEFGEKTCLSVPLWVGDEPLGLLILLATHEEHVFTDDELQLAQGLGEQAAVAMFNARTFRAQEVKNRHLTSLLDVGRALTSTIEIDEVLAIVARQATEALDSDECVIFEYDAEADTITARSFFSVGPSDYDEIGVVLPLDRYPEDRLPARTRRDHRRVHLRPQAEPGGTRLTRRVRGEVGPQCSAALRRRSRSGSWP